MCVLNTPNVIAAKIHSPAPIPNSRPDLKPTIDYGGGNQTVKNLQNTPCVARAPPMRIATATPLFLTLYNPCWTLIA